MTTTIALAGKGGVGKTTVAGMIVKYLAQNQPGSILAIDADPSSNLNMVLGLDLEWTVGDILAHQAGAYAGQARSRCRWCSASRHGLAGDQHVEGRRHERRFHPVQVIHELHHACPCARVSVHIGAHRPQILGQLCEDLTHILALLSQTVQQLQSS